MAKPFIKGNELWKLREKSGRPRVFATPEDMWKAAVEYFKWADENPLTRPEMIRAGELAGTVVQIPVKRPYTMVAFAIHAGFSQSFWKEFRKQPHQDHADYLPIIDRIESIIYTQKFENAAIGLFNTNLIARELGLADRQEHTGKDGKDLIPETTTTTVIIENPHARVQDQADEAAI